MQGPVSLLPSTESTTCFQVADWVAARAVAIDRASGQVSRAAELLAQSGAAERTVDVQQLQSMLAKGVYSVCISCGPADISQST